MIAVFLHDVAAFLSGLERLGDFLFELALGKLTTTKCFFLFLFFFFCIVPSAILYLPLL